MGSPELATSPDGRPLVRELAGPDRYLVRAGVRAHREARLLLRLDVDGGQRETVVFDGERSGLLEGVDGVGGARVCAAGPGSADAELDVVVYTRLD